MQALYNSTPVPDVRVRYADSDPIASAGSEIIERLNREINGILADPRAKARFAELGAALLPGSPADFGKLVSDETEKWAKVVKFSGAKAD